MHCSTSQLPKGLHVGVVVVNGAAAGTGTTAAGLSDVISIQSPQLGRREHDKGQSPTTMSTTRVSQPANHRLRGSGSTVVTMTSKVNGTMEISTPCRSETPENIENKIGKNDYVMGPFNPANFRRNRSSGVRSPYS